MSRRVARLTLDNLADLSGPCSTCVFWQLDPVRRIRARGHEHDELSAWVSEVLREWGSCGRILYVDDEPAGSHPLRARGLRARGQPAADRTGVARTPSCWSRPGSTRPTAAGGWAGCSCRRWPRTWSSAAASGPSRRSARCPARRSGDTTATAPRRRAACCPPTTCWGSASAPTGRTRATRGCGWTCARCSPGASELEAAFDRLLSPVRRRSPAVRPPTAHTPAHRTLD